jgi:hypothetical protein
VLGSAGGQFAPGHPTRWDESQARRLFGLSISIARQLSRDGFRAIIFYPFIPMLALLITPMFAAAGYSLIYLLFGGGFGGAVLIFIVAKMFGK